MHHTNNVVLTSYRDESVVGAYASASDLQPAERELFAKYVEIGARVLDLGVGGGRTAPHLAAHASRYLGVDISPEMIEACRKRFPNLEFDCHDARDLSLYPDGSFDVVVFSFNGIGHLSTDEERRSCLREMWRVLAPGGRLVYSLHNARGLFLRPVRESRDLGSTLLGLARSLGINVRRASSRLLSRAFWQGSGYMWLNVHGRNRLHMSTPQVVRTELAANGFELTDILNDYGSVKKSPWLVRWYYYAARRIDQ